LKELMESFVANGGEIWACGACAKPRGIQESNLVKGARVVSAANVVELLASGAGSIGF
jgi:predicted peroxiredoxin